jgi:hypothetical protein
MGVHACGLQPGAVGELAEDEERAGSGECAAAGVEEELGAVAAIEVRAAEREVAADGLGGRTSERNESLLIALPEHADDPFVEGDAGLLEADCLGDAKAGTVEKLDEGTVAECPRRRPRGGVDEPLRLSGRERAR